MDRSALEAKREAYKAELAKGRALVEDYRQRLLRLEGAILAIGELLAELDEAGKGIPAYPLRTTED